MTSDEVRVHALRAHAVLVINQHCADDAATCHVCKTAYPCPLACLAEHNLELCAATCADGHDSHSDGGRQRPRPGADEVTADGLLASAPRRGLAWW